MPGFKSQFYHLLPVWSWASWPLCACEKENSEDIVQGLLGGTNESKAVPVMQWALYVIPLITFMSITASLAHGQCLLNEYNASLQPHGPDWTSWLGSIDFLGNSWEMLRITESCFVSLNPPNNPCSCVMDISMEGNHWGPEIITTFEDVPIVWDLGEKL